MGLGKFMVSDSIKYVLFCHSLRKICITLPFKFKKILHIQKNFKLAIVLIENTYFRKITCIVYEKDCSKIRINVHS